MNASRWAAFKGRLMSDNPDNVPPFARLLDALESLKTTTVRLVAITIGIVITAGLWIVHLRDPSLLDELGVLRLVAAAAPFAVVMCLGHVFFPDIVQTSGEETGPMSGYIMQARTERRRKVTVLAFAIGAANLLFMLSTRHALSP